MSQCHDQPTTLPLQVKVILVNIFGGIMRCDVIASGIVNAAKQVLSGMPGAAAWRVALLGAGHLLLLLLPPQSLLSCCAAGLGGPP